MKNLSDLDHKREDEDEEEEEDAPTAPKHMFGSYGMQFRNWYRFEGPC